MKVLVTGAEGQLGSALTKLSPPSWRVCALVRAALDVGDAAAVTRIIEAERPDIVVNAAGFTAVDLAETERDKAWRANAEGPGHLARAAAAVGARTVHVSTDFVFDGTQGRPYRWDDATAPINVYGQSKRAGEEAVLAATDAALVVRTSWLYASGGRNFLATILRILNESGEARVVCDQIGAPTSTSSLARALWTLIDKGKTGVWHYANAGVASWYDFAVAIAEEGARLGLVGKLATVSPIATSDWPTPARRPAFSVLDCAPTWLALGGPAPHWRDALRQTLRERLAARS